MFKLLVLILLATTPSSSLMMVSAGDFATCPGPAEIARVTKELQAKLDEIRGGGKAIVAEMKCVTRQELEAISVTKASYTGG